MAFEAPAMDDARIDIAALFSAITKRLPRILLVTVGLLVVAFVVLMFQPRLYDSSASILVEDRSSPYVRASNEQAPTSASEVGVVSSQIALLKSRDTLLSVIDELDLRSNPEFNGGGAGFSPLSVIMQLAGRRAATPDSVDETVLKALDERLAVAQEKDSRVISVTVSTTDPSLSARIANAVAAAHVARRAQLSISDTVDASGWLRQEIERLRVSVKDAETAVANFKVDNDLFTGQNNTSLLDQQLSTISAQITDAQQRKNAALSRASLIRGLIERDQPIEGVGDVQNSVVIQRLSEQKANLQAEKAQRSATLLANHPTIRALNAQIGELNNQIKVEAARVAASLEAEAQIEGDLEASLQADLARAKSNASLATRDTVTLDSLQREAKAQRDLLEAYLLRFNEASTRVDTNSALPDVRVVSIAAPSVTPSSPKTSLIMGAVGVLSVVLQVGFVAFAELMSGRALMPVATRTPVSADEMDDSPFDEAEVEPDQPWRAGFEAEAETEIAGLVEPAEALRPVRDEVADFEVAHLPTEEVEYVGDQSLADQAVVTPDVDTVVAYEHEESAAQSQPAAFSALNYMDAPDPDPVSEHPAMMPSLRLVRQSDLVSDLVLGRTHLLLLADHETGRASTVLAEEIIGLAIAKGLSVALIDAGTGKRTDTPGISDLSTGQASFGDVVQKSADQGFAEVSWGQGARLDRRSPRPVTLVEALGDIYEVVVVLTGRVGRGSSLDLFAELGGRIVLVADDETELDPVERARQTLAEAGLAQVEVTALSESVAA